MNRNSLFAENLEVQLKGSKTGLCISKMAMKRFHAFLRLITELLRMKRGETPMQTSLRGRGQVA